MTKHDEQNRKIAEWIEPLEGTCYQWPWNWHDSFSPRLAWRRDTVEGQGSWPVPRDFFTDEAASAMVLDKLIASGLNIHINKSTWRPEEIELLCPYFPGGGGTLFRYDRRTAFALAALYHIDSIKEEQPEK